MMHGRVALPSPTQASACCPHSFLPTTALILTRVVSLLPRQGYRCRHLHPAYTQLSSSEDHKAYRDKAQGPVVRAG